MDKISNVRISECSNSIYIRPVRMHYEQDGQKKTWDLMKIHDAVSIIIFNVTRQVLIFVKQFRPAVYFTHIDPNDYEGEIDSKKYPASLGMTTEVCAGICDKDQSLVETARDEILEECGYDVPLTCIQKVTSYRSGVGIAGSIHTLFYAEVTDNMKTSLGGGNSHEGEFIEVIEMTLPETQKLIYNEEVPRSTSLLVALLWFFSNKAPKTIIPKL